MGDSIDIVRFAEVMQERVFSAEGHDPETVLSIVQYMNDPPIKHKEGGETLTLDQKMVMSTNEHAYRSDEEAEIYFKDPRLTKYDKISLMQRLVNLRFLCEAKFKAPNPPSSLHITTLPISILNAVCCTVDKDNTVLFFNEGILYAAPALIKTFNAIPTDIALEIVEKGQVSLSPDAEKSYRNHVFNFIQTLLTYMSDQMSPTTMQYGPGKPFLPSAFETWKFQKYLKRSILNKSAGRDAFFEIYRGPLDSKARNFYTARGFFLFLFAHEYSHFAHGHNLTKANGAELFPPEYFEENFNELRAVRPENANVKVPEYAKECFMKLQPLEQQADADALDAVITYCDDHSLSEEQRQCMFSGVSLFFLLSEIVEQVMTFHQHGLHELQRQTALSPIERNLLFAREHPCAVSRIFLSVENAALLKAEEKDAVTEVMWTTLAKGEAIWKPASAQILQVVDSSQFRISPMLTLDLGEVFSNESTLGCFGFSKPI